MPAYQSALSEAAHKVTSRKGWPAEQVQKFVTLTDLATAALCSYDASSMQLVIDQATSGLQATLSGIGGAGGASAATISSFQKAAKAQADSWSVDEPSGVLSFCIN